MALPTPLIPTINYGLYSQGFNQADELRKRNVLLQAGPLIAGGATAGAAAPVAAPGAVAPLTGGLGDRIRGAESGGRVDARNPRSSAYGPDQFISSTWLSMIKRHRPDLAAGKSDGELLAMRSDPSLSGQMRDAYTSENQSGLKASGLPVTDGTSYLAHFAGLGGAKNILRADPSTPVSQLMTPAAIAANPFLRGMTAGGLRAWADRKVGGGQATAAAAPASAPVTGGLTAAANVLLNNGMISEGLVLQNQAREQQEKSTAQTEARQKEMWGIIGDLALAADTPEKWTRAIQAAKAAGLDVSGLDDFSARDLVLARSNRMKTAIDLANKEGKVYEVGGNLVRETPTGVQTIYSAPAAPPKPFQLQAADRKEVYDADEAVESGHNVVGALDKALELNKAAYSGPTAGMRGYVASQFGAGGGIATEELENVVLGQVLDSLKATFGAAPTEGERQILVDVQGSVNKSPEVRERVYKRAQEAARKRIIFNQEKAGALRGGEYFKPGYSPAAAPQGQKTPAPDPLGIR